MSRRECAPAAERNREPILEVLRRVLPAGGSVLEIAAGTGQHAAWFAAALPDLTWQPTDAEAGMLGSIGAWCEGLVNVTAPLQLDVTADRWPIERADAIVCANMIHIAPWAACEGLLRGAGRVLGPGGVLYLYGPYRLGGAHTAPSNEAFDHSLRARDPRWGVRDLEAVVREAAGRGLVLEERVAMPANNQSLIFTKPAG
jgi:SAM-dependent methyltransferase